MVPMRLLLKLDPSVVMYLVIIDKLLANRADLLRVKPSEKFFDMVREQVIAHLSESAEPPKEIAGAIMNISDDLMAGREVTLRAGDYIALMSYAKAKKML
ncbi:MAG: hypothetical protein HGB01_00740 [Chlorobiaceae bacterium]|nr:hypothetical protein [Chlorobiales bacterium]NTV24720.1 hypothetical protein [Chlorobiaceae bacterium]